MLAKPSDGTHLALVYAPDIYLYNRFGDNVDVDSLVFPYMYSSTPIVIATRAAYPTFNSLLNAAVARATNKSAHTKGGSGGGGGGGGVSGEGIGRAKKKGEYEPIKICMSQVISAGYLLHKALERADERVKYLKLVECGSFFGGVFNGSDTGIDAAYVGLPTAIENRENERVSLVGISGKTAVFDLPDTSLLSLMGFDGTDLAGLRGFAVNKNVSESAIKTLSEKLHRAHKVKKILYF